MKKSLTVLAVLIIALVVLKLYVASSSEGFEGQHSQGPEVVILKASWCGHCKAAMPEFEKLVAASPISLKNGQKATVRMLDDSADKAAIQNIGYKVRGYPTILIVRDGNIQEHTGERTMKSVVDTLNQ